MAPKGEWRVWAKQNRTTLLTPHRSQALIAQCLSWEGFLKADELLITWPTGDELDVRPLIQAFQGLVYLPRITGPRQMAFHQFESEAPLVEGSYGILEPEKIAPLWQPNPRLHTLLMAPALCVDAARYRLGYGGGYFDAWLHAHRPLLQESLTVASLIPLALVVKHLPHDDWDQRLDTVLTEDGGVGNA